MYDKEFRGKVTIEDTLQILFVRNGRERLDAEIEAIFGVDDKQHDEEEKEISYQVYVGKAMKNFYYINYRDQSLQF